MNLISIKSKTKKRVGRGIAAGQGKSAGRGTKGQKARSGYNIPTRFEGGQTPLSMRLPKLPGFKSHKRKPVVISLDIISANFKDGETVTSKLLIEKKLIRSFETAKVLNNGTLTKSVIFSSEVKVSKSVKIPAKKAEEIKVEKPATETETPKSPKTPQIPKTKPATKPKTTPKTAKKPVTK